MSYCSNINTGLIEWFDLYNVWPCIKEEWYGRQSIGYEARPTNRNKTQQNSPSYLLICKARIYLPMAHRDTRHAARCLVSQEKGPVGHDIIYRAFSFIAALTIPFNSLSLNFVFLRNKLYLDISLKIKIIVLRFYHTYTALKLILLEFSLVKLSVRTADSCLV
jgi:hypothetical protein